jgi:hypothetical protein
MASVALAGPPRVNDKLQTCPTVYKSGTLVELALRAFFCQTPDASLNYGVGLSRDISYPATHRFAKHNGFRESFSNTQCLVCFSGSVLEISFALSCIYTFMPGRIPDEVHHDVWTFHFALNATFSSGFCYWMLYVTVKVTASVLRLVCSICSSGWYILQVP